MSENGGMNVTYEYLRSIFVTVSPGIKNMVSEAVAQPLGVKGKKSIDR